MLHSQRCECAQTITATPRQLESLIRISESLARMRLSRTVERSDAAEALRLMQVQPLGRPHSWQHWSALFSARPASFTAADLLKTAVRQGIKSLQ